MPENAKPTASAVVGGVNLLAGVLGTLLLLKVAELMESHRRTGRNMYMYGSGISRRGVCPRWCAQSLWAGDQFGSEILSTTLAAGERSGSVAS